MFKKILIANRGEIACRVIKTARRLGIQSVAVYSDADAGARHVRWADEALRIGPPRAAESYLNIDSVLVAAHESHAEAIHPGYGFLSENGEFAEACAKAGVVFIGPPPAAMRAMGSKSAAKALMEKSNVPLLPGYHGDNQAPAFLRQQAETIGYPVLIKASAGGGGKGMRIVEDSAGFDAALGSCQREAQASFGDARVLLEKYLLRPRHIEIQVFADSHGRCVHLFERDCSVQRRHQKVLEEAPAPGMTEARRQAMGAAATAAARAVGYVGAGTVEFIVDEQGVFYFMEMNTRLQVEHPVTEMITGVDLAEWQLRIAAGESLPLTQERLAIRGHALEARIYAEDPAKGFLPSTGKLIHLAPPEESVNVRVDSGAEQNDTITPYYDPMIAKLIVWDQDRAGALKRMSRALAQYRIVGVANNVEFLGRLVAAPAFVEARLHTGLIEQEREHLFPKPEAAPANAYFAATLAVLLREGQTAQLRAARGGDHHSPWHLRDGWRLNSSSERRLVFRRHEIEKTIGVVYVADEYRLELDGAAVAARASLDPNGKLQGELSGSRFEATVVQMGEQQHIFLDPGHFVFVGVDPLRDESEVETTETGLRAPMPGKIVALLALVGSTVKKGAPLLVLEAMKMEHTILAPSAGTIVAFNAAVGEQVGEGVELVEFESQG